MVLIICDSFQHYQKFRKEILFLGLRKTTPKVVLAYKSSKKGLRGAQNFWSLRKKIVTTSGIIRLNVFLVFRRCDPKKKPQAIANTFHPRQGLGLQLK